MDQQDWNNPSEEGHFWNVIDCCALKALTGWTVGEIADSKFRNHKTLSDISHQIVANDVVVWDILKQTDLDLPFPVLILLEQQKVITLS